MKKIKIEASKKSIRAIAWLALILPSLAVAMPMLELNIDDMSGQLLGAKNVNVSGSYFDVDFLDGTCVELFNGCDSAVDDFIFPTIDSSFAASEALLNQVLIDSSLGPFRSFFRLINGCSSLYTCAVVTPTAFDGEFLVWRAARLSSRQPGYIEISDFFGIRPTTDFVRATPFVYGVWTASPAASVPEPTTVTFLLLGLVGLTTMRHMQKS